MITLTQRVTASEAKEQIEKSLAKSPWHEEAVGGVTLYVQESKKPIAFCLPTKQTLVIGPAKLVREILVRNAPVQLSGKLAATWARLDQSHTIGLMIAPPTTGEPARAFLPDDLCNGCEAILAEADVVAGKDIRFRLSVPCLDTGVAYQIRGLCATFVKIAGTGSPLWVDAAKSFQFAVNDRCFVLQGTLPASFLQSDLKTSIPPAAGYTVRSFLPDELCDGIKSVQLETDMVPGKDLHLRVSVPCVDAGIAHEVRGVCEMFVKAYGCNLPFPKLVDTVKSFQYSVNDRCFVMQGTLPANIFEGNLKTTMRNLLADDVCDGIKSVSFKADMDAGKDIHIRLSIPCVDADIAYQIRGLCAIFMKAAKSQGNQKSPEANAMKSFKYAVNDRSFELQGTLPVSIFHDNIKAATSRPKTEQAKQTPKPQRTPQQQTLCELTDVYHKGFQSGLMDPQNKEEAGRQFLAKAKKRHSEFPRDAKLNEAQRMFRDISDISDQGFLQAAGWQDMDQKQKADEERWLKQLKSNNESARMLAIHALTVLHSKKAMPGILEIAADRKEKDNADRMFACRALGIIGDQSVVPDLVHLTYHYNRDTRFWAQISLVRLTGENFGRDVDAWRQWWQKQGGKTPISEKKVAWATSPQTLQYADPKEMEKADREVLDMAKKLSAADGKTGQSSPPQPSNKPEKVPVVEIVTNDIQADGSIQFTASDEVNNVTGIIMKNYQFRSSDFFKVEKIADNKGQPVHFTTEHNDKHFYYDASLNEPLPVGKTLALKIEGTITTLVQPTGQPGEFKYHMAHSPNAPFSVRRSEVHRLPPGAELLKKSPADISETRRDGRIELHVERTIPAGGVIEVSYVYRLPGTK